MVCIHKYKTRKSGKSVFRRKSWKMGSLEETVDAATQWVEEREVSCQTEEEDVMVDSKFSQTLDRDNLMEGGLDHDEGTQTMLPDSVILAFAILANRSENITHLTAWNIDLDNIGISLQINHLNQPAIDLWYKFYSGGR